MPTDVIPERELLNPSHELTQTSETQANDLAAALQKRLSGEVRFDPGSRALYATDLSIYRQPPIGVVIPRTIEDVILTVEECRARGIPILGRGCGTSLAGQTCNVAVVIDFSKYLNRLLEVDPGSKSARVEPGIIRDDLGHAAKPHNLMRGERRVARRARKRISGLVPGLQGVQERLPGIGGHGHV